MVRPEDSRHVVDMNAGRISEASIRFEQTEDSEQEESEGQLNQTWSPYRVQASERTLEEVLREVDSSNFRGYRREIDPEDGRLAVESLAAYERLLEELSESGAATFQAFRDWMSGDPAGDAAGEGARIVIRHDVDSDLTAAMDQAEIEAALGIRSTYYILHTASYYGEFRNGVFHRHEHIAPVLRFIASLGHEIGLHIDPLWIHQEHGIDGAEAVRVELDWLRSLGLEITGTAGHNGRRAYGAMSSEIFRGRGMDHPLLEGTEKTAHRVVHHGKAAPLQVLDAAEIGVEYDVDDVRLAGQPHVEAWILQARQWQWRPFESLEKLWSDTSGEVIEPGALAERIRGLPGGTRVMMVVHPCYFGARDGAERPSLDGVRRRPKRECVTIPA